MWRYRDYVVRSFNEDKPYDQFIIEQIAGDELWEKQPLAEKDSQLLVATSFLRMGPWDPAMVLKPQARQLYLDDVVNSVGQTFLSTTMRCFKCHDHKFDPLPTRDYYRFYAAFSGTQLAERPTPSPKKKVCLVLTAEKTPPAHARFRQGKTPQTFGKAGECSQGLVRSTWQRVPQRRQKQSYTRRGKPPRYVGLSPVEQGRLKVRRQDEWIWTRRLERYEPWLNPSTMDPYPNP